MLLQRVTTNNYKTVIKLLNGVKVQRMCFNADQGQHMIDRTITGSLSFYNFTKILYFFPIKVKSPKLGCTALN